jgi:multidrug resistance protein MdtO
MFVREDLFANIVARIDGRLRALSDFYSRWAIRSPNLEDAHKSVAAYAWRSTAGIRHTIATLRTTDPQSQERLLALSTITALTARLIDVTATLDPSVALSEEDSSRLLKLAAELDRISKAHNAGEILTVHDYQPSGAPSAAIPVLPELERTAAMIPNAVSSEERKYEAIVQPSTADERTRIFIPDAFSNPAYLIFAMKTMLAALLCYVIYSGLDWQGVSTSVVTCLVTALNTSGATRQKQLLRLTGAVFGGVLALGSIVLLLPETDRLTGVTLLVTAVSAFCAWFALASQRVSYFGLQAALAFYLALIQDYRTTTDLAPARDRALGVLLGVAVMWLVFDNLWPVSATKLMVTWFVRNVRSVGQVLPTMDQPNRALAIQTLRSLRDRIQNGFTTANGHADSVLFEFGSRNRAQHLALRNEVLRAQATLRTLFTVELAISQVRQSSSIPLTTALENFDQMISKRLENIANAVEQGRAPEPSSEHVDFDSLPDGALRPLLKRALELTDTLEEQCRWHVNWGERVGELAKS